MSNDRSQTPAHDLPNPDDQNLEFEQDSFEKRVPIYRWTIALERLITSALVVGVFVLVMIQVITRYVFDSPLSWSEEAARLTLVWLTFLAAAYVSSRRTHISVDIIATIVPAPVSKAIGIFAQLLVIAVAIFMAVSGFMMIDIVSAIALPATSLPTALLYSAAALGFILIIIHTVLDLVMTFKYPDENPDNVDAAAKLEGL